VHNGFTLATQPNKVEDSFPKFDASRVNPDGDAFCVRLLIPQRERRTMPLVSISIVDFRPMRVSRIAGL
jgi:hypothetical protein